MPDGNTRPHHESGIDAAEFLSVGAYVYYGSADWGYGVWLVIGRRQTAAD